MTSLQAHILPTSLWGKTKELYDSYVNTCFFLITLPAMVLETPTVSLIHSKEKKNLVYNGKSSQSGKSEGTSRVTLVPKVLIPLLYNL